MIILDLANAKKLLDQFKGCSKDTTRPFLHGIHLIKEADNKLIAQTTDGYQAIEQTILCNEISAHWWEKVIIGKGFDKILSAKLAIVKKDKKHLISITMQEIMSFTIDREFPTLINLFSESKGIEVRLTKEILEKLLDSFSAKTFVLHVDTENEGPLKINFEGGKALIMPCKL